MLTKAKLIALLAAHRITQYPDLYRGHEGDATIFFERTGGKRGDLLTAAINYGLVPRNTR